MCSAIVAPFQKGKAAFMANIGRDDNPHLHQNGDARAEWEAGYNYGLAATVIQPEGNEYAPDVYSSLLVLARMFEEQQYFSAAEELRDMAARGPEQHKGMEKFSTTDVLRVASERLAEISRMNARC